MDAYGIYYDKRCPTPNTTVRGYNAPATLYELITNTINSYEGYLDN